MSAAPTDPRRTPAAPLTLFLAAALWAGSGPAAELPPLSQRVTALEKPVPAPALRLEDLDEVEHDLAEYVGRLVLVNFWATWCPPCRREMPSMERLHQQLADQGLTVLAVNLGEDGDTVFAFTGQLEPSPTFPMLIDPDGKTAEAWGVRGLPTSFVVDPQGRIILRAVGGTELDDPDLMAELRRRLPEAGQPPAPRP
jgi:thiol-disulfide isomerase/thioredoxin